ncbi:hypothetical protein Syun_021938 [Stephania yunnanensis]|uniref:C2H2-type domain-containing protein n=1 Tax=Stephania yunnanensis TaxID=152371 RepID=A0AAP0IHZ5_9MAGN
MDEVKDKMKGLMKKMNNSFTSSSSSGKFKGQGRVLGSSSSGPINPINPIANRANPTVESKRNAPAVCQSSSNPKSVPDRTIKVEPLSNQVEKKPSTGFDPFDSLITSSERSKNGYSLNVFECPVCGQAFRSEDEVSVHIESCIGDSNADSKPELVENGADSESVREIGECVGAFVSGGANEGSIEVVLKLLRNIVREPENSKFRRIRLSNPKIREAIGEVVGGVELLECVGFGLEQEGEDMWAVMEVPSRERLSLIREAVSLLEPKETQSLPSTASNGPAGSEDRADGHMEPKKIDRQIRVFFSVPECVASQIVLPDSFYSLSIDELKREADSRKKKIAESQLLIPKSYKEKQAKAAKKRYKTTVIRIQFPDEVVLQAIFLPWERTTALYEFVSSALKQQGLEFELWHPAVIKRRMIPRFSEGDRAPTLEEEDLVPSALIKFKPFKTDSIVFTGLSNELLEKSEPLTSSSAVPST